MSNSLEGYTLCAICVERGIHLETRTVNFADCDYCGPCIKGTIRELIADIKRLEEQERAYILMLCRQQEKLAEQSLIETIREDIFGARSLNEITPCQSRLPVQERFLLSQTSPLDSGREGG